MPNRFEKKRGGFLDMAISVRKKAKIFLNDVDQAIALYVFELRDGVPKGRRLGIIGLLRKLDESPYKLPINSPF